MPRILKQAQDIERIMFDSVYKGIVEDMQLDETVASRLLDETVIDSAAEKIGLEVNDPAIREELEILLQGLAEQFSIPPTPEEVEPEEVEPVEEEVPEEPTTPEDMGRSVAQQWLDMLAVEKPEGMEDYVWERHQRSYRASMVADAYNFRSMGRGDSEAMGRYAAYMDHLKETAPDEWQIVKEKLKEWDPKKKDPTKYMGHPGTDPYLTGVAHASGDKPKAHNYEEVVRFFRKRLGEGWDTEIMGNDEDRMKYMNGYLYQLTGSDSVPYTEGYGLVFNNLLQEFGLWDGNPPDPGEDMFIPGNELESGDHIAQQLLIKSKSADDVLKDYMKQSSKQPAGFMDGYWDAIVNHSRQFSIISPPEDLDRVDQTIAELDSGYIPPSIQQQFEDSLGIPLSPEAIATKDEVTGDWVLQDTRGGRDYTWNIREVETPEGTVLDMHNQATDVAGYISNYYEAHPELYLKMETEKPYSYKRSGDFGYQDYIDMGSDIRNYYTQLGEAYGWAPEEKAYNEASYIYQNTRDWKDLDSLRVLLSQLSPETQQMLAGYVPSTGDAFMDRAMNWLLPGVAEPGPERVPELEAPYGPTPEYISPEDVVGEETLEKDTYLDQVLRSPLHRTPTAPQSATQYNLERLSTFLREYEYPREYRDMVDMALEVLVRGETLEETLRPETLEFLDELMEYADRAQETESEREQVVSTEDPRIQEVKDIIESGAYTSPVDIAKFQGWLDTFESGGSLDPYQSEVFEATKEYVEEWKQEQEEEQAAPEESHYRGVPSYSEEGLGYVGQRYNAVVKNPEYREQFTQQFPPIRFGTSNAMERMRDPKTDPIFETASDGAYYAIETDRESYYMVMPRFDLTFQESTAGPGAMGQVFDIPGYEPRYSYPSVKVAKPALFRFDTAKQQWFLQYKGELDLGQPMVSASKLPVTEAEFWKEAQEPYQHPYDGGGSWRSRGAPTSEQLFERGYDLTGPPEFPYQIGDEGTLAELNLPIVSGYLEDIAKDRYGIRNFLDIVNNQDPKIIKFIMSKTKPHAVWEDDNLLLINLYHVHDVADLMGVLIHDFAHVMSVLAGEPMSDKRDRADATVDEYVEFPEEQDAYIEYIQFRSFILREPRDFIKEKLFDIVGDDQEEKINEWLYLALGDPIVTADYPSHPDTIIIESEFYPRGITEADIWRYYDQEKEDIVSELQGHNAMLVIKANAEIYKRHSDGGFVRIDSVEDFEKYNNGRTVEFHKVLGERTPYGYIDVDPKEAVPFVKTRKVTGEIYNVLKAMPDVVRVALAYSGGRGFHLYPYYTQPKETEQARIELREAIRTYIGESGDDKLTTGITRESDMIRLDTSTLKETGSLRVFGSLNAKTGLRCMLIDPGELTQFKKEGAKINITRVGSRAPDPMSEFYPELIDVLLLDTASQSFQESSVRG